MSRLKRTFYVANLHWNNAGCRWGSPPFPSLAYEVLFVNKRIAVLDPAGQPTRPNPLDHPNRRGAPDCQVANESSAETRRLTIER